MRILASELRILQGPSKAYDGGRCEQGSQHKDHGRGRSRRAQQTEQVGADQQAGNRSLKQQPQIFGVNMLTQKIKWRRDQANDAGEDEGGADRSVGRQTDDEDQGRDCKAATADAGQSYGEGNHKADQVVHHSALFEKTWIFARLRAHFFVVGAEARERFYTKAAILSHATVETSKRKAATSHADCRKMESRAGVPLMLDDGVWAEIKVGGEHLRLFSEHSAQGLQASVYNVTTKTWIVPSEPVDDIEDGKDKAEQYARAYLEAARLELPPIVWKDARSR
jgi:hypothetical protein